MNKSPINRLAELTPKLPYVVINDISKRMEDWVLSGGKQDDPYMWQQVKFAENWIAFNGGLKDGR